MRYTQLSAQTHERNMLFREIQMLSYDKELEFEIKKPIVGHIAWVQESFNQGYGLSIPIDNKLNEPTKQALSKFQRDRGLSETKKLDFQTERRLLETIALSKSESMVEKTKLIAFLALAGIRIEDWTNKATIPEVKKKLILNRFRDPRTIKSIILHQMAYKAKDKNGLYSNPERYLSVGAHFCIMLDGRIMQHHPISRFIWHSNCTSPLSIGVEFEGNFPNIKGKWWYPTNEKTGKKMKKNEDKPTPAQFEAGQFLLKYLKTVIGLKNVLAHRQSSEDRENDPGPDIWFNVGEWGLANLGLSDGGKGFKCGTGNLILEKWRTWSVKP